MKNVIRQSWILTAWNLRNMRARLRRSVVAVTGFFGVVLVFVVVLSIRQGISRVFANTGSNEIALVKSNNSSLDGNALHTIGQAPGVAQGAHGPLVMGTFGASARIPLQKDGLRGTVEFLGVGAEMPAVWTGFRIVQGRMFKPGLDEIIVGRQAQQLYRGLALGDSFNWNHRQWKVVGVFTKDGGIRESEIWADVNQLQSAYNSANQYSGADVRLTSAAAFPAFKNALESNPQLGVSVVQESSYFQQSFHGLSTLITEVGGIVTLLMAIGAVFGAVKIMYSNIANRMGDVATLRTLGFQRLPVLFAVLLEAILLSLIGGVFAILIAYFSFNGYQASTVGNHELMAFQFTVSPWLIVSALALTLVMGLIGGLFPAIRAARLPVARALREA